MNDLLVLIPLLPLAAALINFLLGRRFLRELAGPIATAAVFGSWVLSLLVFINQLGNDTPLRQHLYTWMPTGDFQVPMTLHVDHLSAVMLMVVSTVSTLVHIYANGYMHGDDGFYRFFSYLPFFVFSMLMLVLADNYLVLFIFWEAVGLSSYLLIGYYFRRNSASNAGKKAFIVNRIGDFGFGLGIMLLFYKTGSVVFSESFAAMPQVGDQATFWIAILLFLGAIGKSAQFPLFVWLPDAMEGPTPVSALIHAATMVTAGVYMVARSYPIFSLSGDAMQIAAIVGVGTAIIAATIGVTQFDIKRVIAYSTVSQLGFMVFALGVGAWIPAIFHLVTHAFFKGLLFLGSGSVIHGMHGEQDMRKMGGLKKYMPVTYWTFLLAALANAGIFPLAGFWSKDEILLGAWLHDHPFVSILGFFAAFFTALYMARVIYLTFHGEERFDSAHVHPHESPRVMTIPLILLAIPAVIIGLGLGWPPEKGWIHDFLSPNFTHEATTATSNLASVDYGVTYAEVHAAEEGVAHPSNAQTLLFAIISTIVAVGGWMAAHLAYYAKVPALSPVLWAQRLGGIYEFVFRKWMFDEIYETYIVHPFFVFSEWLWRFFDVKVIDGTVNGVAGVIDFAAAQTRKVQTGFVANYALAMALGAVVIIGAVFAFQSNLFG